MKEKRFLQLILAAVILVNIKSIFCDFDIDTEYAIATSYRNILGDRMFGEMLEPHQTSSFLCTILMRLYLGIVGSSTGIVLYLHTCGVLIHSLVAWLLYKVLQKKTDNLLAALIGFCFAVLRPKDMVFPDFANMQIWFSVLMFLALTTYFEDQKKKIWLAAAALCLCLTILSYPSCIIMFVLVLVILGMYGEEKWKDCIGFSLICGAAGSVYVAYFVARSGLSEFIAAVRNIVTADGSHGADSISYMYFDFFADGVKWLAACAIFSVVAAGVALGICRYRKRRINYGKTFLTSLWITLAATDLYGMLVLREGRNYMILWPLIIALSFGGLKYCDKTEKRIVIMSIILSAGSYISTMLLTNLDIMSIMKYVVLALVISFIPLSRLLTRLYPHKQRLLSWWIIGCFGFLMIFRRGVMVRTMDGQESNLLDLGGIVKSGPAVGLVTDYMGAYEMNGQREEWQQYVRAGDNVYIVGSERVGTLAYMLEEVQISAPSTICTPTYGEFIEEYWEKYPEKKPNVVIVQCWYGNLKLSEDNWIMQWIHENMQESGSIADGKFWRYYRLEE